MFLLFYFFFFFQTMLIRIPTAVFDLEIWTIIILHEIHAKQAHFVFNNFLIALICWFFKALLPDDYVTVYK